MSDHTTHPAYISLTKRAKDITGVRFTRLVALGPVRQNHRRVIVWRCRCDCGKVIDVASSELLCGKTKSCGCFSRDATTERSTTHGLCRDPLYRRWQNIIQRCTNPSNTSYASYGGRGITICDEWRYDFAAFRNHVSQLPHCGEKGYTLDRIDNSLGYSSDNLRFATASEQTLNTRRNFLITYNGETKPISDWANEFQIRRSVLRNRLLNLGWSIERALTTPRQGEP